MPLIGTSEIEEEHIIVVFPEGTPYSQAGWEWRLTRAHSGNQTNSTKVNKLIQSNDYLPLSVNIHVHTCSHALQKM